MTLYAGTEADYGNMAVTSLANDMEKALLLLIPEVAHADVKQRKKLILMIAQGVINHINQHITAQVNKLVLDAAAIEIGAGATNPAVLGTQLRTYLDDFANKFNNHAHGTGGNTPTTSVPAVPAAVLSTKVRVG